MLNIGFVLTCKLKHAILFFIKLRINKDKECVLRLFYSGQESQDGQESKEMQDKQVD